ncbi:hypothetical protein RHGRI_014481 [Rhododendron griersonianum]|uniref:AAA+ ATPase domain-containing protein n=1 Tax=Rhododendron griersonianum TaxID=479676 RepID=A0AAV6K9W4_9ERIC|nr:hypothetical protein RHGRI_014481 [Rhododendron griersonianum]
MYGLLTWTHVQLQQIQELVEAIVLPMTHKERFQKLGIRPPKGVLLYGPPGTGKTLMARACAAQTNATFLKLAGPQLVQMFIGDGAKLVDDAFQLAKEKSPCIIFIDEIDAIGTKHSTSLLETARGHPSYGETHLAMECIFYFYSCFDLWLLFSLSIFLPLSGMMHPLAKSDNDVLYEIRKEYFLWKLEDCKSSISDSLDVQMGYIDREVLGINHMYAHPAWKRSKACTKNSPYEGPFRNDAPSWCLAPFEPEGILRFLCIMIISLLSHASRLRHWVVMGLALLVLGITLHFTDAIPLNKQLYTFSYVSVTSGAAALVFSAFYVLVDIGNVKFMFLPLEWIGMNAMLVYVMAAEGIFAAFINGWYYDDPHNTLVV